MVSLTALLTALVFAQDHGAVQVQRDELERMEGLQHALERRLEGLSREDAVGVGFLAAQVTRQPRFPSPNLSSFLLDEHFVIRGAEGNTMKPLPWFAEDMFVAQSLRDIDEMPHHVRNDALLEYDAVMRGERRLWRFTSYGLRYTVDSVPLKSASGRPIGVLALCRLIFDPDAAGVQALTSREREILQLASEGLSGPDIADALTLSAATVKTHFQNIYAKCGVSDRAAAVAKALRQGAIS